MVFGKKSKIKNIPVQDGNLGIQSVPKAAKRQRNCCVRELTENWDAKMGPKRDQGEVEGVQRLVR